MPIIPFQWQQFAPRKRCNLKSRACMTSATRPALNATLLLVRFLRSRSGGEAVGPSHRPGLRRAPFPFLHSSCSGGRGPAAGWGHWRPGWRGQNRLRQPRTFPSPPNSAPSFRSSREPRARRRRFFSAYQIGSWRPIGAVALAPLPWMGCQYGSADSLGMDTRRVQPMTRVPC